MKLHHYQIVNTPDGIAIIKPDQDLDGTRYETHNIMEGGMDIVLEADIKLLTPEQLSLLKIMSNIAPKAEPQAELDPAELKALFRENPELFSLKIVNVKTCMAYTFANGTELTHPFMEPSNMERLLTDGVKGIELGGKYNNLKSLVDAINLKIEPENDNICVEEDNRDYPIISIDTHYLTPDEWLDELEEAYFNDFFPCWKLTVQVYANLIYNRNNQEIPMPEVEELQHWLWAESKRGPKKKTIRPAFPKDR